jgi:hypothetical protein
MHSEPPLNVDPALSREGKEEELHYLLHQGLVREGTQLHALLAYLGTKALDPPETLKEYTIGVEALGKPADLDPRIDPTVRVEIAKLRKRLKEYYLDAGASRPIHLEIPHGSYLPVFTHPSLAAAPEALRHRWKSIWPSAAAAILLIAVIVLVVWRHQLQRMPPALAAFWGPHLEGGVPTLLVCGTPMFLKVEGGFYRDTNVNRPEDVPSSKKVQKVVDALAPDELRPVFTFVGRGEAHGIFALTRLLAAHGANLLFRQSNEVGWVDMKGTHVIFLGGKKYNPQIPLLPYKPAFEAVNRRILNLHPANGEPEDYRTASLTPHGELTREYALISVYPGLSPNTRLLTMDCSSTEGTLAAAEFLTREDMIAQLIAKGVPVKPVRGTIRAFQTVINARYNKGVVVSLSYVTHRVMEATAAQGS